MVQNSKFGRNDFLEKKYNGYAEIYLDVKRDSKSTKKEQMIKTIILTIVSRIEQVFYFLCTI